jgi:hypothetical protein
LDNNSRLVLAMVEQCRNLIVASDTADPDLPKALRPKHLLWMCNEIEKHAEHGPATKLHRWIGFIQGAILANRMLDLDGLKEMLERAKTAQGKASDDAEDLTDHLDPASSFEFDIGGQG